ncbi:MAG: hypothetical protein K6T86_16845 [Pirellulales bacterium]|nr:hypothetical protein [Pirellulales bacterium]
MQNRSRWLRKAAADLVAAWAKAGQMLAGQQSDLITSLVRQWVTYEGNATIFFAHCQVHCKASWRPEGRLQVHQSSKPLRWLDVAFEDWKIDPAHKTNILEQLNLAQNAEVRNREGVPIGIRVDPQRRTISIEPRAAEPRRRGRKKKIPYRKIASDILAEQLAGQYPAEMLAKFAASVARQWETYDGAAGIFLPGQELILSLKKNEEGGCTVSARREPTTLEALLQQLGVAAAEVPEVIMRLNTAQTVAFVDPHGLPCELWHDPRVRRIHVRRLAGAPGLAPPVPRPWQPPAEKRRRPARRGRKRRGEPPVTPPVFCPRCNAVLPLWGPRQRRQTCPACGCEVDRS